MVELEKINFENYKEPGLSKEILDALQTNIENAINEKNIMTRKFDRQNITITSSWGNTEIPLTSNNINSIGEKITAVSNGIKIGKGISKVLVSAQINGIQHPQDLGDKIFQIRKNGTQISGAYQTGDTTSGYIFASISQNLIDVSENDIFTLNISSGAAGTLELLEGYLTVEEVQ